MNTFLFVIISILAAFALFIIIKRAKQKHIDTVAEELQQIQLAKNISKMIHFDNDLGFTPDRQQIIYIQSEQNTVINQFIESRFDDIYQLFATNGYSFFYLPNFALKICDTTFYEYHFPGNKFDSNQLAPNSIDYSFFINHLDENDSVKQGLIRHKIHPTLDFSFSYFQLNEDTDDEMWNQFLQYISMVGDDFRFSLGKPETEDDRADFDFWKESTRLMDEIKERVDKLRIMGVEEMLLKSLTDLKPATSSLLITADYRIMLPEYNKEITMHPLPKAIYLLFLKYPEGILFKELPNFKEELTAIYKKISSFEDVQRIEASIADVTDPSKNAINEKCSRIREAFVKEFDDTIAQQYYITGKRAEPKRIQIDRAMVKIEATL